MMLPTSSFLAIFAVGLVRTNVEADGQLEAVDAVRRHDEEMGSPFHEEWFAHSTVRKLVNGWAALPASRHLVGVRSWGSLPSGMRATPAQMQKIMVELRCLDAADASNQQVGSIGGPFVGTHGWKTWNDMRSPATPYAGHLESDQVEVTYEKEGMYTRPNGAAKYIIPNMVFQCSKLRTTVTTAVHLEQRDLDRIVLEKKADMMKHDYTEDEVDIAVAAMANGVQSQLGHAQAGARAHMKAQDRQFRAAQLDHAKGAVKHAVTRDKGPRAAAPQRSRGGDWEMDVDGMLARHKAHIDDMIEAGILKKLEDITPLMEIMKWMSRQPGDKYGGVFTLGTGEATTVQQYGNNAKGTYAFEFTQDCSRDESQYKWEFSADLQGCTPGKRGLVLITGSTQEMMSSIGDFTGTRFVMYVEK